MEVPTGTSTDKGEPGRPRNSLTRSRNVDEVSLGEADDRGELGEPLPDTDGSLDPLPLPSDFQAGDLIELHDDGDRVSLLAVCLGFIDGTYHFYTATGKWHPMLKAATHFLIRNFVSEKELQPVVDKLPKGDVSYETMRAMRDLKMGPDRACGAQLLRKMAKFSELSEVVMQKYATRFECAHETLAQGNERYFTLEQIASRLMGPKGSLAPANVPIQPYALYAVHRTVISDDVGFRLLGNFGNARTWLFEITPPEDVALIKNMQVLVRLFMDIPGKLDTPLAELTSTQLSQSQLGRFILKAREAIDHSRQSREWTPHGMLGPATKPNSSASMAWTDVDLSILHYMHLWSGYDQFSHSSRFHWIGSAILRATARYKDSEFLSTSTGWTFLQELGYIAPWDIHARYSSRLPGIEPSRERGFKRMALGEGGVSAQLTADRCIGRRKEWADHRAFAVDSRDTTDIDDAVSIEAAETPGEHWIHVHVADPASRIPPQSPLGERAQLVPLNLYLSGHDSNIWGIGNEMQELFSLGPNKPCLTFSGRVNEQGELLEYKITPGTLHDYIFMTPADVNAAVGYEEPRRPPSWSTTNEFRVGKPPAQKADNRKMTTAAELQPEDLESLKTLHRLAHAIRQRRLAKDAMPTFALRPTAKASFDETSMKEMPPGLMTCDGDPTISITWNGGAESPMVTNTMVLAGEIAARWCTDRKIPIAYVTQPHAERNLELLRPYKEMVYASLLRGEEPDPEASLRLRALIGADELSTRPGSYFLLGLDCYSKVTSPLRRYTDLLAHWQIHSALAQEAKTGKVTPHRLPFQRPELDRSVLPWLKLRQRVIRRLGNVDGNGAYILQALLRAWKFPAEGEPRLPATFRLRVLYLRGGYQKHARGVLDWFGIDARMVVDGLWALGVRAADIRPDDVFEVSLHDINVHRAEVFVKAVGKVRYQADEQRPLTPEAVVAEARVEADA